ncbi:MAG: alpha/beta hydrolase [Spirochaetales bacterium]|nr:alpha/beta hydrolase [Spirochaetales bacterium]
MRTVLGILNIILKITVKRNFKNGIRVKKLRQFDISIDNPLTTGGTAFKRIPAPEGNSQRVIVYFHGGAYVSGPDRNHLSLAIRLSKATGSDVLLVDYRRAPENTYIEAHIDAAAVYEYALENYPGEEIVIAGDSSGGGLALAFTMSLRDAGGPLPSKLVMMSPWLDVSMSNPEISPAADVSDPVLSRAGLAEAGAMFAGSLPPGDYHVSPVLGRAGGMPPMLMLSSSLDILVHDCRLFHRKCKAEGTPLIYSEYPGLFHAWILMPPVIREAQQAFSEVVEFIID